ncbi:hypothetical protein G9A89_023970 [Geosiphon pyriformis]|nr:hypothetical protein G9A89_023970 [Geosiphon pyriformis]
MKFTTSFLLAASFIASNTINASIFTTSPYDSITWQADTTVIITWNDNGKKPSLKDMGDVSIFLMTGNTQQVIVDTIVKSVKATAGKQEYKVKKNLGPPGKF